MMMAFYWGADWGRFILEFLLSYSWVSSSTIRTSYCGMFGIIVCDVGFGWFRDL
jgi:hypothetical protein